MSGRTWGSCAGAVVALVLSACSGGGSAAELAAADAASCTQQVTALAGQLQGQVDRYVGVDPLTFATDQGPQSTFDLPSILTVHQARLTQDGCDLTTAAAELASAIDGLRAEGAVAASVAQALRAAVAGTDVTSGRRIEVGADDDLAALALSAPSGSVLELLPGEHQVDETMLVAQRLAIVGQDPGTTRIVSTAEEVALLVAGSGALELRDLTLAHEGDAASTVVLILSPWYRVSDVVITGGGAVDEEAGGAGVLLAQGPAFGPSELDVAGLEGRLERVEVSGSAGPGVAVQGDASPRIDDAEVHGNGSCGLCYLGSAGGSLSDSVVRDNGVGLVVGDTASPQVLRTHVRDNRTDGVLLEAQARGSFRELEVTANADRGVMVTGEATPTLQDSVVDANGEVGVALTGTADATLAGMRILGHQVGLWVGDGAVASVMSSDFEDHAEAAIVLRETARVTGSGNACRDVAFGVITFDAASTTFEGAGCDHQRG